MGEPGRKTGSGVAERGLLGIHRADVHWSLRREGGWLVLRRPLDAGAACGGAGTGAGDGAGDGSGGGAGDGLGAPGPWRVAAPGLSVFELPVEAWGDRWRRHARGAEEELADWARATLDGARPAGWSPPPRAELLGWFPASQLTVRTGATTSLGELVHDEGTLRLQFPLATRAPSELPDARRRWLDECLASARARWRFVRVGLPDDGGPPRAEVDLTGAPPDLAEPLVRHALSALRWVVAWSLPPLAVLTDTGIASALLDFPPMRAEPAERERT